MLLDLIVVLIIALFTFIGYKQGLVKTAIKIISFFIAIIVSITLYKVVGNAIIDNTNIDEKIQNTVISKVLPEDYEEKYQMLPNSLVETGTKTITDMANQITEKIVYAGTFIVLFIILKLVLKLAAFLVDFITKLPIIKQFDKTGGIIYGFLKGFLILTLVFAIISLVSPMLDIKYIDTINHSYLSSLLYNHNLLIGLIK